ncbi:unnamed protein product [Caenorhabditis brenneri]
MPTPIDIHAPPHLQDLGSNCFEPRLHPRLRLDRGGDGPTGVEMIWKLSTTPCVRWDARNRRFGPSSPWVVHSGPIGAVALGFEHNQVLQTGTLTVEDLTAESKMFGPKTYKAYYASQNGSWVEAPGGAGPGLLPGAHPIGDRRAEGRPNRKREGGPPREGGSGIEEPSPPPSVTSTSVTSTPTTPTTGCLHLKCHVITTMPLFFQFFQFFQ